jgi:hypothetical protein
MFTNLNTLNNDELLLLNISSWVQSLWGPISFKPFDLHKTSSKTPFSQMQFFCVESIDNNSKNNKQQFQHCRWIFQTIVCPSLTWKHQNPRPFSFSCERYIYIYIYILAPIFHSTSTSNIWLSYDLKRILKECPWKIVNENGHFQIFIIVDMSSRQYKMNNPTWSSPKSSSNIVSLGSHAITHLLSTKTPSFTSHSFPLQLQCPNERTFMLLPWTLLLGIHIRLFVVVHYCAL